jgi:predicted ATPase/DNA-binding winged helix-turn-helix (wHTH) protein
MSDADGSLLAFGPFRLSRARKLLTSESGPVPLGSRAFELLSVLVERAGQVVTTGELAALVWPNTVVEASSIRVHVAALRKALSDGRGGARFVINIPGRGYSFVASVRKASEDQPPDHGMEQVAANGNGAGGQLPARLTHILGRADIRERIARNLPERRFLTLVGPGGIGKTALAIEIAASLASGFDDGVVFVDLSLVKDAIDAPAAIAARLGISNQVVDSEQALGTLLRRKHLLLVLDNCEHVAKVVAPLVQRQLLVSPHLLVLATSREPLGVVSETLYRLQGLEVPPPGRPLTRDEAMRHESVQLFVQRASASSGSFLLTDEEAPVVGDICRWLGGNPLAIELVAARADLYGVSELAAMLDTRMLQSPQARRTALPRHRTLAAMLDWSYRLLSVPEQVILRRLAVFRSSFSMQSAKQVASDDIVAPGEVAAIILKLATKSLVLSDVGSGVARYELAGLTRTYVYEKFLEGSDHAGTRHRHARYMLEVLNQSQASWPTADRTAWTAAYGPLMEDVLSALEFALTQPELRDLAMELLAAGAMLGVRFSRLLDFEALIRQALSAVENSHSALDRKMRLRASLSFMNDAQFGASSWLAEEAGQSASLALAQGGVWIQIDTRIVDFLRSWVSGDYAGMLRLGNHFAAIARDSDHPLAVLVADRIQGQALHFSGDHDRSRVQCERVMSNRMRRGPLRSITGTTDFRVSMRIILARIHWLQGRAELAAMVADEAIEHAKLEQPQSLCLSLAFAACPIALWSGDVSKARVLIEHLREQASDHSLRGIWLPWAQALGELLDHRDDGRLGSASSQFVRSASKYGLLLVDHLYTIEPELALVDGFGLERGLETSWCAPELQRLSGERLLRHGFDGSAELAAEARFKSAIAMARMQNAVSWELRASTSLARLWQGQSRDDDAYQLLSGVYERIPQGRGTADLLTAGRLLMALDGSLRSVG